MVGKTITHYKVNEKIGQSGMGEVYRAIRLLFAILTVSLTGLAPVTVVSAQTPWALIPSPTSEALTDVHFVNALEGWAVGWNGTIIHSTDGGLSWQEQESGVGLNLWGVHFATPERGWAVGVFGVVVRTENGGATWTPEFPSNTGHNLFGVFLTSPFIGYVAGNYWDIWRTVDGGKTFSWDRQGDGLGTFAINRLAISGTVLYGVGTQGKVLRRAGLRNWALTTAGQGEGVFWGIHMDGLSGWIAGDNGEVRHSLDGGNSWNTIQPTPTNNNLRGISFTSRMNGWIVGFNGTILHTSNPTLPRN